MKPMTLGKRKLLSAASTCIPPCSIPLPEGKDITKDLIKKFMKEKGKISKCLIKKQILSIWPSKNQKEDFNQNNSLDQQISVKSKPKRNSICPRRDKQPESTKNTTVKWVYLSRLTAK
jgi:hypothetical protein